MYLFILMGLFSHYFIENQGNSYKLISICSSSKRACPWTHRSEYLSDRSFETNCTWYYFRSTSARQYLDGSSFSGRFSSFALQVASIFDAFCHGSLLSAHPYSFSEVRVFACYGRNTRHKGFFGNVVNVALFSYELDFVNGFSLWIASGFPSNCVDCRLLGAFLAFCWIRTDFFDISWFAL